MGIRGISAPDSAFIHLNFFQDGLVSEAVMVMPIIIVDLYMSVVGTLLKFMPSLLNLQFKMAFATLC